MCNSICKNSICKNENCKNKKALSQTDRSDAVNLARNVKTKATSLEKLTDKGVEVLIDAVIKMDHALLEISHEGEVVVTKNSEGVIVSVTRQDADGKILSIISHGKH